MPSRFTQPTYQRLDTDHGVGQRGTGALGPERIDPAHTLSGAVKAFNQRRAGRRYEQGQVEALFDAVRAFNRHQAAMTGQPAEALDGSLPSKREGLLPGWNAAPIGPRPEQEPAGGRLGRDLWKPSRPPLRPLLPLDPFAEE